MKPKHIPVMLNESLGIFKGQHITSFFDGTLGAGGFAKALLKDHPEIATYYGCDQDRNALKIAAEELMDFKDKVVLIHANFSELSQQLSDRGVHSVSGFFLTWECHPCSWMKKKEGLVSVEGL